MNDQMAKDRLAELCREAIGIGIDHDWHYEVTARPNGKEGYRFTVWCDKKRHPSKPDTGQLPLTSSESSSAPTDGGDSPRGDGDL